MPASIRSSIAPEVVQIVEGYAEQLEGHDLRQGEVMVISSNSGINPLPVEMGLLSRGRGLGVVAITSLVFSQSLSRRSLERFRLFEIADVAVVRQPLSGRRCPRGGARRDGESRARILDRLNDAVDEIIAVMIERLSAAGLEAPVLLSERHPGESQPATSASPLREPSPCPVHGDALLLNNDGCQPP